MEDTAGIFVPSYIENGVVRFFRLFDEHDPHATRRLRRIDRPIAGPGALERVRVLSGLERNEPQKAADFVFLHAHKAALLTAIKARIEIFPVRDIERNLLANQIILHQSGVGFRESQQRGWHIGSMYSTERSICRPRL